MYRVLITGGAGFIGSHLAERFLALDAKVTAFDDMSTGSPHNVAHLNKHPGFKCVTGSVFDYTTLSDLVDQSDIVFHLAAAVGVRLVVDHPVRTMETNVHGTEMLLRAAARKRKRVIVTSTSEVYGKSNNLPFKEDSDLTLGPPTVSRWSYACSKALDEFLALAYWKEHRVPTTVVRLFNTVGPRQSARYGMVLARFMEQASQGEPITIHGSGEQTRCFAYVKETVECLIRLSDSSSSIGEVFNIGNNEEVSIKSLALLVKEVTGSPSNLMLVPYESAYGCGFEDMQRRVPSLEKLESAISYRPSMSVRRIIELLHEHRSYKPAIVASVAARGIAS